MQQHSISLFVGHKIKQRRKQLGISQTGLADLLDLSYQQIQKYENGNSTITIQRLFEVANILNVKPEYFYEGAPTEVGLGNRVDATIIQERATPLQVLLVEDSADDELLLKNAIKLCEEKVELHTIHDSDKVMDYLQHHDAKYGHPRPDIILLDLNMPKIDGLSLLKQIKRTQSLIDIPVIMLTNSVLVKEMRDAYQLSANGFMQKSFDFNDFSHNIKNLVTYWSRSIVLPSAA